MPYDILLGISIALSVMFFWMGRRLTGAPVKIDGQIERYLDDDINLMPGPVVARNLSRFSFVQRVIVPAWRDVLTRLGSLAPQRNLDALAKRLDTAGRPQGLTVLNFLGLKLLMAPVFAVVGYGLGAELLHRGSTTGIVLALSLAAIGFYIADVVLLISIANRQHAIVRALPDALDMIVVCVEAGQSFDQALKRVSARWRNPLTEEFNRILTEIALGRTRREALSSASERIQLPEISNLITAIIQADLLGVRIGQVLRAQADQMRIFRRQRAQELAREAAIKLLFPLVFLIFPAMFAVLLGPAIPMIMETFTRVR